MKFIVSISILLLLSMASSAQVLNIHKTDGTVIEIPVSDIDSILFKAKTGDNSINSFCELIPAGWSCEILYTYDSVLLPVDNRKKPVEEPLAIVKYSNDSLACVNNSSLFLFVYDIARKDALAEIISTSAHMSWCIPMFFGENENYYVITSPCYLSNTCWTHENLRPLLLAIKDLFTVSIIDEAW